MGKVSGSPFGLPFAFSGEIGDNIICFYSPLIEVGVFTTEINTDKNKGEYVRGQKKQLVD